MAVKAPGSGNYYRPLFAADVFMTDTSTWLNQTLANKHPITPVSTTVDETASSTNAVSNNLITETALVDYVGTPSVTTNGTGIVRPMHKLYARSITETTNAAFSWIKAGVHDVTSGYDTTKDN
eukprot:3693995-Prymnesium_polylepis.1